MLTRRMDCDGTGRVPQHSSLLRTCSPAAQIMNTSFDALNLVNTYGAFGSIGRERLAVIFEGTDADNPFDPETSWKAIIPTSLCQSTQTRCLLKSHRTNRVSTGKCGSPRCRRRKNTHGLSIWFGNCCTTMPTRSVCLRSNPFPDCSRRSLFGRRSTDISSRSRTIPITCGGRANYSEAGFRHSRPTILGCAAFCSRLAGSKQFAQTRLRRTRL